MTSKIQAAMSRKDVTKYVSETLRLSSGLDTLAQVLQRIQQEEGKR